MNTNDVNIFELVSDKCSDKVSIGKVSNNKLMKVKESIFKDIFMNSKSIISEHINLMASYNVLSNDYKDEEIDTTLELIREINTTIDYEEYELEGLFNRTEEYLDLIESANNLMYEHLINIKKSQRVMADIELSGLEDLLPSNVYNSCFSLNNMGKENSLIQYVVYKTIHSIEDYAKGL